MLIKRNPFLKVFMFGCFATLKHSRFYLFGALVKTKRSLARRQRNTGLGKCPIEYKITWIKFSSINHWVMERKWHSYKSAENRLSSNWVSEHEGGHQEISAKSEGDPSYRVSDLRDDADDKKLARCFASCRQEELPRESHSEKKPSHDISATFLPKDTCESLNSAGRRFFGLVGLVRKFRVLFIISSWTYCSLPGVRHDGGSIMLWGHFSAIFPRRLHSFYLQLKWRQRNREISCMKTWRSLQMKPCNLGQYLFSRKTMSPGITPMLNN